MKLLWYRLWSATNLTFLVRFLLKPFVTWDLWVPVPHHVRYVRTDRIMLQMFRFKFISVDENDWHLFLKGEGQAMKGARRSINTRNLFTVQVA